jgi:hypothetical protein
MLFLTQRRRGAKEEEKAKKWGQKYKSRRSMGQLAVFWLTGCALKISCSMARLTFKSLFCERFGCTPEAYEEQAFRQLLYWHARFFAPVVRIIRPNFFLEDFEFIRYLGEAADSRQARVDALDFKDLGRKRWRLLHTGFRIRVSHRKARRLALQLLGKPEWQDPAAVV